MEFRLDDGQLELQGTVARLCEDRFPLDGVVAREGAPLDRTTWRAMADLGVFGLMASERDGGSGLGVVEAALVFEQLGDHLAPGPTLWTVLAAGLVDGAISGDVVVGGVDARSGAPDGWALVEHAADIDVLLVLGPDSVRVVDGATLGPPTMLEPLDPTTPVGRFGPDGVLDDRSAVADLLRIGTEVAGPDVAEHLRTLGTVLVAAQMSGIASRSLTVAREYALERRQFDAPIGSFQAVKHLLADMYVRSGLAQSASYAAAAVLQDPGDDDPSRAAASAAVVASDAAIGNAGTAVQVLGGMGFTWDMLPNHLLKRAWVLEQAFGDSDAHATRLGADLAGRRAPADPVTAGGAS